MFLGHSGHLSPQGGDPGEHGGSHCGPFDLNQKLHVVTVSHSSCPQGHEKEAGFIWSWLP